MTFETSMTHDEQPMGGKTRSQDVVGAKELKPPECHLEPFQNQVNDPIVIALAHHIRTRKLPFTSLSLVHCELVSSVWRST